MESKKQQWVDFVERYRADPVGFVRDVCGVIPDDWQAELLEAIAAGERRISVRSGHGVGKSTVAAWACLWYIFTRYPVKIVITAPTTAQLYDALYAEIRRWFNTIPPGLASLFEVKSERIELKAAPSESFISARTSRAEQPEALQGVHSKNVLLIADEASGIPESVYEAAGGSMSGHSATTLLLGNPVRGSGYFYDTHTKELGWKRFHVSSLTSPRVSADYVREMAEKYGEDSNAYRIRVLGEFPLADDDTIIPLGLVQAAVNRDILANPSEPVVWGLDVARKGGDSSVLVKRKGNIVAAPPRIWRNLDLMQLTGAIVHEYDVSDLAAKPAEILVDSIGLGSGVVDRLRELGYPVRGINVSESPALGEKVVNLRSELWSHARSWFEKRMCSIPNDERLIDELTMVKCSYTSSGKLMVEPKDAIRKRTRGRSCDVADAFCLTFASTAATALHGWSPTSQRNKPLRRRLKGLV